MDKCREGFESKYGVVGSRMSNGNYSSWTHQAKWEAFKTAWRHKQAKVEELQEEFAEDERFLKEQIKDKDLKISNLEYQQGMDKELIQTLQCKVEKLQKQLSEYIFVTETIDEMYVKEVKSSEELQKRVDQQGLIIAKAMSIASDLQKSWSMFEIGKKLEQALKGEE